MYRVGRVAKCFQNLCESTFSFPHCYEISATAHPEGQKLNSVGDEVHRRLGYDALQYLRSPTPHPPVMLTVVVRL